MSNIFKHVKKNHHKARRHHPTTCNLNYKWILTSHIFYQKLQQNLCRRRKSITHQKMPNMFKSFQTQDLWGLISFHYAIMMFTSTCKYQQIHFLWNPKMKCILTYTRKKMQFQNWFPPWVVIHFHIEMGWYVSCSECYTMFVCQILNTTGQTEDCKDKLIL